MAAMELLVPMAIAAIALALVFDFTNGYNDSGSLVATMVASRALSARRAVVLAGVFEFLGPMLGGTAVANTVGKILILDATGTLVPVVLAGVSAAIFWNVITWYVGIPSSSSHAIFGGLVGAALVATGDASAVDWGIEGFDARHPRGVAGVAMTLFVSPFVGFAIGFVFQKVTSRLLRGATPRANRVLRRLQLVTASALAFSHGTNDAQKTMGIITVVLVSAGWATAFEVPTWVKLGAATMIAAGAMTGGWRIMKTVGSGIFRVRPIHGFSSQGASAAIILSSALLGGPVSTAHVVSSSVMGVGSAARRRAVRWGRVREILVTWAITIPASAALAGLLSWWLRLVLGTRGGAGV